MSNTLQPVHFLVCSALGVGHFTPASNFVRLLCETHKSEVYVTFFAPLRPGEAAKSPDLPPYENVQVEKYVIEDATPIIMVDMKTKADQMNTEISALLARAYQKGWPELSVVIHDSFAWYAHHLVQNSEGRLLEYIFNPSHSIAGELFDNQEMIKSILNGESHFTFKTGKTVRAPLMLEMCFGPREPLLENEGKESIFTQGEGTLSSDIAGLDSSLRTTNPDSTRKVYPLSPLCVWQEHKTNEIDETCQWLDLQPDRSVIYIALGSLYPMHRTGIYNLATALERLEEVRFLWAIDEAKISQDGPQVSEDYKKKLAHRGLVVPWVNQPRVLAHPAVRGFISHCGWNSLVENATLGGHPLICLPLGSEQHVNALVVEGIWKCGLCPLVQSGAPALSGPAPVCDAETPMDCLMQKLPYMARWQWPEVEEFCLKINEVFYNKYESFALQAARLRADCLKGVAPGGPVFQNLRQFLHDVRSLKSERTN